MFSEEFFASTLDGLLGGVVSEVLMKVRKTVQHHARRTRAWLRGGVWDVVGSLATRPIFVVGCSRAGTTLVYKTFSESREIGTLQREDYGFWDSLHPLAEREWVSHALGAGDASDQDRRAISRHFYRHTGRHRFVDKNNQNGLCVPYLCALFPDASFVYVKRGPGDNINSLIEGWRRPEQFATWSHDLPSDVAIEDGAFRRWCFFLPEGWRSYLTASIEEVCAFQYRAMNEAILSARRDVPTNQWIEIRYEDLIADPIGGFRAAFEGCGLRFSSAVEQHCRTVLARPYNAFSEVRLDKWKTGRNSECIARILASVSDVAREMGYGDMQ